MTKAVVTFVFAALVLAGPAGCGGAKSVADRPADAPRFRLLLGKGGGFTGQWRGFLVHGDGSVWTWRGIGLPAESLRVATLDAAALDSLRSEVESSGLLDSSTSGTGNLSARLELTLGDRSAVVTWASGLLTDAPDLPEERFYRHVERILARLEEGR